MSEEEQAEEEEQEEEEADTELKTKTPHVNVGKNRVTHALPIFHPQSHTFPD